MILVGIALPLALAVAALLVVAVSASTLPNPVATHWGPTGAPDGYGPLWVPAALPLIVTLGYSVLVLALLRSVHDRTTVIHKLLLVTGPFVAVMVSVVVVGSVLIQRGLADASNAPSVVPVVLLACGAGLALAVLSWFALPRVSAPQEEPTVDVPTVSLTATERASWIQHAEPGRFVAAAVSGVLVLASALGTVALWAAAPLPALLLYLALVLVIVLFGVGSLSWQVRIDRRGFRARSLFGWPRFTYSLSEIRSAAVVQVNPIGDFGGCDGAAVGGGGSSCGRARLSS
jgi:hypothetical protein